MSLQGYDPEAIGNAAAGEAVAERRGLMETVRDTRLGEALAVAGIAVAMAGGVNADTARANANAGSTMNAEVVKLKMNLKGVKKFIKKCRTSASRRDLPVVAPPADPLAKCKLKANPRVKFRAKLACPPPYLGGSLTVKGSVRQKLRGESLAKSEVPSIVRARAMISDKVKFEVKGSLTCVKLVEDQTGKTPESQPPVGQPPVPGKDGAPGAGTGIGDGSGGGGAGGNGNTSPNSVACYDPYTQGDGDQNANTGGAPMWGTAKDQYNACVGAAVPAVN